MRRAASPPTASRGLAARYRPPIFRLGLILAAWAALLCVATGTAGAADGGMISGCIRTHDGEPAAGATAEAVTLVSVRYATAGDDGCYLLEDVAPGSAALRFVPAEGATDDAQVHYGNAVYLWDQLRVEVVAGTTTTGIDAQFAHAGSVSGRLTGPDGAPLAGVTVWGSDGGATGSQVRAVSDADGRYVLTGLSATPFKIEAVPHDGVLARTFAPGHDTEPAAQPVQVLAGTEITGVDIAVRRAATVSGRVTDAAGLPLAGITVTLASADMRVATFPWSQVSTDMAGRYRIPKLHSGPVQLEFRDETWVRPLVHNRGSYSRSSPPIVLGVGEDAVVDVTMALGGGVAGTLRDEGGRPLPGREIRLQPTIELSSALARTDAAGRWSVSPLPSARYDISVQVAGAIHTRPFAGSGGPVAVQVDAPAVSSVDLVVLRPGQLPELRSRSAVRPRRGVVSLPLRCPSACRVELRARGARAAAGGRSLGSGSAAARARSVRVRLTRAGSRRLRRSGARASLRVRPAYGDARTFNVRLRRGR